MQRQSLFAIATTMLVLAIPAVSQTFADGQWSGSIQCKLDVEQPGYSRHEIQTWTLTGQPPRNEGMWIHPATWAYAGGGHIAQAQGPRMVNIQWNINVPPSDASLAMFVRASDKKFIIRLGYSPRPLYDAVSGMRQITLNGTPQPPGRVNFPVSAWQWPWIEATAGTNVSGSMSIQAESLGGDLAQPGGPPTAVCKYQFSRAGASPDLTPASQNCSQSAAKISQTFDTMEGDIAKRYEALIQQTKDSTQATALSTQEKNLISRLETLKQQNLNVSAADCNGGAGATYTAQNPPGTGTSGSNSGQSSSGTGQGMNGTSSTQNPAGTSSSTSNSGQTQTANGPATPPTAGTTGTNAGQSGANGQTQTTSGSTSQPGGTGSDSEISPAPQLLKVDPASGQQNTTTMQVALTGQGTHWLQGTTKLDFGPGITVQGQPVFLTATDGYVAIAVAPDAVAGPRTVTVTSPFPGKTEKASLPNAFNVTAKFAKQRDEMNIPVNTPLNVPANPPIDKTAPRNSQLAKQLTTASTPAVPTTSGDYLITITGLKCAQATLDVPIDGLGDEVYAAAAVWRYNRLNGVANGMPEFHDTVVYGDVSHAIGREMAGSKSPAGGIQSGDTIPMGVSYTRNAAASDSRFPLRIFQGTLRDNLDALVISPSVWEYDGSASPYGTWQVRLKDSFTAYLFSQSQIQEQINTKTFGSFVMNGFGITLPVPAIFSQTLNRPIGLVGKDFGTAIFPTTVVVLTREIIEAALSNSSFNTEPAPGVFISSPGNIVIGFGDHGDANPLLNNTDINDSKGIYYLVLQVERVASPTQPQDPTKAPSAGDPSASQKEIMDKLQKAADQQKQMQDSLKVLGDN